MKSRPSWFDWLTPWAGMNKKNTFDGATLTVNEVGDVSLEPTWSPHAYIYICALLTTYQQRYTPYTWTSVKTYTCNTTLLHAYTDRCKAAAISFRDFMSHTPTKKRWWLQNSETLSNLPRRLHSYVAPMLSASPRQSTSMDKVQLIATSKRRLY